MTDDTTTPAEATDDVVVVAAEVTDEYGALADGAIAAEGNHALIVARFADPADAVKAAATAAEGDAAPAAE